MAFDVASANRIVVIVVICIQWRELVCPFTTLDLFKGHFHTYNTLRPSQNGRHFPYDIFKCIFLNENVWIPFQMSLKFVLKGPINNIPALVQIMAWHRPGDKPLSTVNYWRINASLGLNELTNTKVQHTEAKAMSNFIVSHFVMCGGDEFKRASIFGKHKYKKYINEYWGRWHLMLNPLCHIYQ